MNKKGIGIVSIFLLVVFLSGLVFCCYQYWNYSGGDDKKPIDCYLETDTVENCYDCCKDIKSRNELSQYTDRSCFNVCKYREGLD